jgi:hypothetical protein
MTFAGAGVCASAGATKLAATKAAAASETLFIVTSLVTTTSCGAALGNEHSRTFIRCALAQFIAIHGWKNRVIGAPAQLAYKLSMITAATAANTGRPKGTLKAR